MSVLLARYFPPVITSVSPASGSAGTPITINGSYFAYGATVTVGGAPAGSVVRVSSSQITCTAPAGTGPSDVVVTNPSTLTSGASGAGAFTLVVSAVPAAFSHPISLTSDGSFIWVSAMQGTPAKDGHIIQKIDKSLASPAVVGVIDVSAYSKGGEGIDGLNPAPVLVNVRQVKVSGGRVFACIQGSKNLNDNSVSSFCVIIDAATDAIVGHVKLLSTITVARSADCRAVAFDGAGNFFLAQNDVQGAGPGNLLHKFSLASVLAAYPGYGTPTTTVSLPDQIGHPGYQNYIEEMAFGAGYIWAACGAVGFQPAELLRIDPTTLAITTYLLAAPHDTTYMHAIRFAFGSIWTTVGHGSDGHALLRFDPATFPSAPIAVLSIPSGTTYMSGSDLESDGSTMWFVDGGAGTAAVRSTFYRFSTGLGTEAFLSSVASPDTTDNFYGLAFDGTHIWGAARFGVQPGLVRVSVGLGTEAIDYSLYDGGPPLPPSIVAVVPNSGSSAGSRQVTVQVSSSTGTTGIRFDGVSLTGFSIVDATHVRGFTVSHAVGPVSIVVESLGGNSSPLVNGYTFTTPAAPSVLAVAPTSGTTYAGYQTVAVTVDDSVGMVSCSLIASGFTIVDPTTVSGVTGDHAAGAVDVTATNDIGTGPPLVAGYTYVAPGAPVFLSMYPAAIAFEDGAFRFVPHSHPNLPPAPAHSAKLTVSYAGQAPATDVSLGGASLTGLVSTPAGANTSAEGTPATHLAGLVDVIITTGAGSQTTTNGFTYEARQAPANLATLNLNLRLKAGDYVMSDTTYEVATTQDVWYGTASGGSSNLRNARWAFAGGSHRTSVGSSLNGLATVAVTVAETNGGLTIDNKSGAREAGQAAEVFGAGNTGFAWVLAKKINWVASYYSSSSVFGGTGGQTCPAFDFGNVDSVFAVVGTTVTYDVYDLNDWAATNEWCLYQMRWDLGAGTKEFRENNGAWKSHALTTSVLPSGGGLSVMSRLYANQPDNGTIASELWIGEVADIGAGPTRFNNAQADGIYEALRALYSDANLP